MRMISTLFLSLAVLLVTSGCSLFESKQESDDRVVMMDDGLEPIDDGFYDDDFYDFGEAQQALGESDFGGFDDFSDGFSEFDDGFGGVNDGFDQFATTSEEGSDSYSDFGASDDFSADPFEDPFATAGTFEDPFAGEESFETDPFSNDAEFVAVEPVADPFANYDDSLFSDSTGIDTADTWEPAPISDPEPTRTWIPVRKIETEPFYLRGTLVNAVYIGRPGDTVESVSQKIFGQDRSQEILDTNRHLRRGFSPGDKLYYTSPQRPNDTTNFLTYWEDIGVAPQIYISNEGDNIRAVSAELMGFEDAWKEVWAINQEIESKDIIRGGHQIRYWPDSHAAAAPVQVIAESPASTPAPTPVPTPPPVAAPPPMDPLEDDFSMDIADDFGSMDDFPDIGELEPYQPEEFDLLPPDDDFGFQAGVDTPTPPAQEERFRAPPPPPPPPPAPRASVDRAEESAAAGTVDSAANEDMIMLLGGLGLLALGVVAIVIVRKRKAKELEENTVFTDTTQIG